MWNEYGMRTARIAAIGALVGCLLPVASAQARPARGGGCDNKRVQTFNTTLPSAPTSFKAGRGLPVPLQVKRGPVEAAEVNATLILRGKGWFAYGTAVTDTAGNATAVIKVPSGARGAAHLTVDVYKPLASIPCFNIEEFDLVERAWGKAVK